ncbi:MAG: hypothetical protein U0T65_00350 [Buchnera aphidicola (Nurudea yanoniella)]
MNYSAIYNQDINIVQDNWMKVIHKQLLVYFLKSKNIIELFFNPQYFGSLLIRLKIRSNKLIKLDLISNDKVLRKIFKSDISNFKNTILKNGLRFENVAIRTLKFKKTSFLKNSYNFYNKVINDKNFIIYNKDEKNFHTSFLSGLYFSVKKKEIVDIYI